MNHGGYKLPQGMPTALYPEEYLGRETGALSRLRINGGADGIRTHYLLTASQTLSQLSYSPTPKSLAKSPVKLKQR